LKQALVAAVMLALSAPVAVADEPTYTVTLQIGGI